jgi:hypothetical protein
MKTTKNLKLSVAFIAAFLATACDNEKISSIDSKESNNLSLSKVLATKESLPTTNGDTLVYVNYESGTLNSGITGLTTTHATASDASYIVTPGRTGSYAVAHKVTLGDTGYFSDGNWRSESATDQLTEGKFTRGDERRYECSLLLKDWTPYTTGMSQAGDIIFQGKLGGGGNPAFYFMTKRNSIAFRMPNNNLQQTIIADFRPYINQWIDFRVDVKWEDGPTGYYKVYCRKPGESTYTLIWQVDNFHTFLPDNPNAVSGYNKWGLYRADESLAAGDVPTRIIYHDDIRIIKLPLQ